MLRNCDRQLLSICSSKYLNSCRNSNVSYSITNSSPCCFRSRTIISIITRWSNVIVLSLLTEVSPERIRSITLKNGSLTTNTQSYCLTGIPGKQVTLLRQDSSSITLSKDTPLSSTDVWLVVRCNRRDCNIRTGCITNNITSVIGCSSIPSSCISQTRN